MPADTEIDLDLLRPHVVSLRNDGLLQNNPQTVLPTTFEDVRRILLEDFPKATQGWPHKRLLLYAHGGLVDEGVALRTFQKDILPRYMAAGVYPVALVWHTGLWTTLLNMGEDAMTDVLEQPPVAVPYLMAAPPPRALSPLMQKIQDQIDAAVARLEAAKNDCIEDFAALFAGLWDEMKENAERASTLEKGGARAVVDFIGAMAVKPELHLAGHSAGSLILGHMLEHGMADQLKFESCSLWAPACKVDFADRTYLKAFGTKSLDRLQLQTLTAQAELDDTCGGIYGKSLLYLVANAFEKSGEDELVPLLGLAECINKDARLSPLFVDGHPQPRSEWWTRTFKPEGSAAAHGCFDNSGLVIDEAVRWATRP